MRHAILVAAVLLVAGTAAAHVGHFGSVNSSATPSVSEAVDEIDTLTARYNENVDSLPSLVKSLVADERVNVHIDTADGEIVVGAVMDDARIATVERGGIENATVEFYTDEETVTAIMAAENSRKRALEAFNSDHITYQVHGFGRSVKFAVLSTVSKILGFLL